MHWPLEPQTAPASPPRVIPGTVWNGFRAFSLLMKSWIIARLPLCRLSEWRSPSAVAIKCHSRSFVSFPLTPATRGASGGQARQAKIKMVLPLPAEDAAHTHTCSSRPAARGPPSHHSAPTDGMACLHRNSAVPDPRSHALQLHQADIKPIPRRHGLRPPATNPAGLPPPKSGADRSLLLIRIILAGYRVLSPPSSCGFTSHPSDAHPTFAKNSRKSKRIVAQVDPARCHPPPKPPKRVPATLRRPPLVVGPGPFPSQSGLSFEHFTLCLGF